MIFNPTNGNIPLHIKLPGRLMECQKPKGLRFVRALHAQLPLPLPRVNRKEGNESETPQSNDVESDLFVTGGPMKPASIDVQGELILRPVKSLLSLHVVVETNGVQLGQVHDLMFDQETGKVASLILEEKKFFGIKGLQIVSWDEITSISPDAILVKSANSKIKLSDSALVRSLKKGQQSMLSSAEILTTEGRPLGTLADMWIDETSGKVQGYEVSGRFTTVSLQGKKLRPSALAHAIGCGAALSNRNDVTSNVRGMKERSSVN